MSLYLIDGAPLQPDHAAFPGAVEFAYANRLRPLCLCRTDHPPPMYIARHGDQLLVKRMPDSGRLHDPACESYEPPAVLSGLGEVLGRAVQPDDDVVRLKVDFTLSRTPDRSAAPPQGQVGDTATADGSRLTLRSLLHYLWTSADLCRWAPAMAGRRTWSVVQRRLLDVAKTMRLKGAPLADVLLLPQAWTPERKDVIAQQTAHALKRLTIQDSGRQSLGILLAEVKELSPARYGFKLIVRHLPGTAFFLDESLYRRTCRRFERELDLWRADESTHLMAIGTVGVTSAGVPEVQEVALVATNAGWLPFENQHELELMAALGADGRHFTRCLRFNLDARSPSATAVLEDVGPEPVALYLVRPGQGLADREGLIRLIDETNLTPWFWHTEAEPMPALPRKGYSARADWRQHLLTDNVEPAVAAAGDLGDARD